MGKGCWHANNAHCEALALEMNALSMKSKPHNPYKAAMHALQLNVN